jgi:serine phosphatase RsbU (regulator of sigma subunit)
VSTDRLAAVAGGIVLAVVSVVYPIVADDLDRPLAFFVLPALLTAVLGGWRPTLLIGIGSLAIATFVGVVGPLGGGALLARLVIIALGVAMGAAGAAARDRQSVQLDEMGEALALREAFQRALAPSPLPPAGFVAVASYRPSERWLAFGGDFLEAVALPDGRLAVLMGDVCGHGPREAAFGSALRAGWKSIALSAQPDPEQWVTALDDAFFRDGRVDTFVTLCTGYLDVRTNDACLVNAGHPPPVVVPPDQQARPLALRVTRPLGIDPPATPFATRLRWSGEPMVFFTDGLIENPMKEGSSRRWETDGLTDWLDRHKTDEPRTLVTNLVQAATSQRDLRDDVAVLVVAKDGALDR